MSNIEDWFDTQFEGRVFESPKTSYFELCTNKDNDGNRFVVRGSHKSYGLCCKGGPETYEALEQQMMDVLQLWESSIPQKDLVNIFWRIKPSYETYTHGEDQVSVIRMRFAVLPGDIDTSLLQEGAAFEKVEI